MNGKFIYRFTDKEGKEHTFLSDSSYEDLSNNEFRKIVDERLFSKENIERALSYNVQRDDSQYGYIGGIGFNREENEWTAYKSKGYINNLRKKELEDTNELKFKTGVLRKLIDNSGKQAIFADCFGYIFIDNSGKEHKIYISGGNFEKLADINFKKEIENILLSEKNIERVDLYNVQDKNSQFGYAGGITQKLNTFSYTSVPYIYNPQSNENDRFLKKIRDAMLNEVTELKFNNGTLKVIREPETVKIPELNRYIYTDEKNKNHVIYTHMSLKEMSNPKNREEIETSLLSEENIIEAEKNYGYIGELDESESKNYLEILKSKKNLDKLQMKVPTNDNNKQRSVKLSNGKEIFEYLIIDKTQKKRITIYLENSLEDITEKLKAFQGDDFLYSESDMLRIVSDAIKKSNNFYGQYSNFGIGYAGRFESNGDLVADESIFKELKEQAIKIGEMSKFKNYMEREEYIKRVMEQVELNK